MTNKPNSIIAQLLQNPVFANVLMFVIVAGGIVGLLGMVRESFPDFGLDQVTIQVPYPGADPEEVEEGITRPIEDVLEGLEGVKRVYSVSAEGNSTTYVELLEGEEMAEVKERVKSAVDSVPNFPDGAEKPIVQELKFDTEVISLCIWGDLSYRQLKDYAYKLKDEMEILDGINQVQLYGVRPYQVSIEVSDVQLRKYQLTFDEIATVVRQNTQNFSGGNITTKEEEMRIRMTDRRYFGQEFENLVVKSYIDGSNIKLSDLATIRDGFDEDVKSYSLFNGKPSIRLRVIKAESEDIIDVVNVVEEYVSKVRPTLPETLHMTEFFDNSKLVKSRINLLIRNGVFGLLLVFISLWLFLDLRMSLWVTLGIPISIAGAWAIMYATGQSINMISMFGLIMVLGIIVDDAIVVGESIYSLREKGVPPAEAAVQGVHEVFWPVVSAILTTIVAFSPLFFVDGIIGKFIGVLPGPVVAGLAVSLIEGLLILPVHLRHLEISKPVMYTGIKSIINIPYKIRTKTTAAFNYVSDELYEPALRKMLKYHYISLAAATVLLLASFGLITGGYIKSTFFPKADTDWIQAIIEMPEGTTIEQTEAIARQLNQAWAETEAHFAPKLKVPKAGIGEWIEGTEDNPIFKQEKIYLKHGVFTLVGGTFTDIGTFFQNNAVHIFVELTPAEYRNVHYQDILRVWREKTGEIPGRVREVYSDFGGGPPGGNIELELVAPSQEKLRIGEQKLVEYLSGFEGVYEINSNFKPGKRELRVSLKPEARHLGLNASDIGRQVQQGFYGEEITRVQREREEIKIMLRFPEAERQNLTTIQKLRVRTPQGHEIPFNTVADIQYMWGAAPINRENRQQLIRITAEVDNNVVSENEVMDNVLQNFAPKMLADHQVKIRLGVNANDRAKSRKSMVTGAFIAMILIYMIVATVFKSYLQPMIIMLTIPFGLIGAILGHYIVDVPMSMMSFFGMIALLGIVVNDSIVLIVSINKRQEEGLGFVESLVVGSKRRLRAIFLTSLTTFAGLSPMILEKSFQAQILIPMAVSIAYGVIFATFATLVVIPCLLYMFNDIRRVSYYLMYGELPSKEAVESMRGQGLLKRKVKMKS